MSHPPFFCPRQIDFVMPYDPSTTLVFTADEAKLEPLPWIGRTNDLGRGAYFLVGGPYLNGGAPVTYDEVAIMTQRTGSCTLSRHNQERRGYAFMIYNGTGYMHDPRIALFDNTLDSPSDTSLLGDDSSTFQGRLGACRNVPKTFQNAHTCRPSTACSPVTYSDASVLLNHSQLRTLHELSNRYADTTSSQSDASRRFPLRRWRGEFGSLGLSVESH